MTDIEALVDGLSSKFEFSTETEDKFVSRVRSHSVAHPEPHVTQAAVGLLLRGGFGGTRETGERWQRRALSKRENENEKTRERGIRGVVGC